MLIIHAGLEDQSYKIVNFFTFQRKTDSLIITAHTDRGIYQGQLLQGKSQNSLDQLQTYLNQNQFRDVVEEFETLKFISYDTEFVLTNILLIALNGLRDRKYMLQSTMQKIQLQLAQTTRKLKIASLEILAYENALKEEYKKFKSESIPLLKIDTRKIISNISQDDFISLIQNKKFPYLTQLQLPENQIRDEGLMALSKTQNIFYHLKSINLFSNRITDAGLKILAESSKKFPNLQLLYLGRNFITDVGLKSFVQNGQNFFKLQKLNLSHNKKITDAGLKALAKSATKFVGLHEVNLGGCLITDERKKQIIQKYSLKLRIYT